MTRFLGLDPVERLNLTFSAGTIAASLALGAGRFGTGVALGTVIEAVNYRVLRRATDRLFRGDLAGGQAWSAAFAVRFLFLGAAMFAAISAGVDPIGLVVGLSLVIPAVVIFAWRSRPPQVSSDAVPPPDDPSWDRWNPWLARERDDVDPEDAP
ncbi:MAG: hypothetical protein JSU66_06345 [Deltaproteobacteria bacterium]|nr:MAG: hypothetical protein JSU66_06345 [Deltaproteobacteria bacterium]